MVGPAGLEIRIFASRIYISLSLSVSLNAGFRERKEGDPASNKTNLRNPCPRKPYLEAPGETPRAERGRREGAIVKCKDHVLL